MTIDGESYDPFSAETLRVLHPPHPSYREEIITASRRKYSIPKDAAAKLIAEEEATIIRSAEEKAIIEGKTKIKAKEIKDTEEEVVSVEDKEQGEIKDTGPKKKASQEAEPMI
ncbi:hypothetical protein A3G98_02420 [Candidatus Nomurabacteria bacterium RIFCSPLOWO2_12_FULL_37_8]|uniref:Uncharacterized protein n=1 Tax=Candidatus Nomurabacteria bacterium RIFCSPLOWO2_12_FULL_37_8 TaxID=1801793 RepID=A0A1F6Y2Y1_9BACT|nr:MAG: hypothetical protein A3G98_02420 [Candidatus Nomurabacteria bacterium RIFCSPLOWO2_12_FULL_37_8]